MASPRPAVLVARQAPAAVLARLHAEFDVDLNEPDVVLPRPELLQRLQGKLACMITGSERIDAELLDACPELRFVSTVSVGFNHIDVPACTARGVVVTNTPDVLTESTADFGFALMMAAARRMSEGERMLRDGRWQRWSWDLLAGADVHGATLGILGMGRIGQAIARRGHHGFGMPVIYHNRSRLDAATEAAVGARYVSQDELFAEADHLILVLPYSPAVHHLVGAQQLALMKPTATLTNVARGGIVDENALVAALRAGRPGAAALDVFEGEPQVNPALLTLPNTVLTPHIASATIKTRTAMAALAVDNLLALVSGRPPLTALNPEVIERQT
ncbi:2-hydroxyacid dehydrogenase [Roseateles paludis]|uniref:D-glycerate dehydrogenase n=1 Tax=Roseateles paludis TaxID=3145238 RepID=A0ABV0G2Y2_9BURK